MRKKAQSVIEYVIIFALVIIVSLALLPRVRGIFKNYVNVATGAMQ